MDDNRSNINNKSNQIRKFIKFDASLRLFAILFIALLSLAGFIPNLTFDVGGVVKHAFGWQSPNTMASNVIIVLLEFMYLKWNNFKVRHWIIIGFVFL